MKFVKLDKKSIIFKLTSMTIIIIFGQTALLFAFLILGGVLKQAEKNAFSSFAEKVSNRKDDLQREMKYHWTNMDPYMEQISSLYQEGEDSSQFLKDISMSLIAMLRSTQTTGAFVILNDSPKDKSILYFRDYDPILNNYDNSDLYLAYGPSSIASDLQIPLDQMWKDTIDLHTMRGEFFDYPLRIASLSNDASLLGYWSLPFQLIPQDQSIITYSMPLFNNQNQVIGIIGVEISIQYMSKFLPATDLQNMDSYGYMIGYRGSEEEELRSIILTREIQKRFVKKGGVFDYTSVAPNHSIYTLKEKINKWDTYLCIEDLNLYRYNTPFAKSQWYLIGIMSENTLLGYVIKINRILFCATFATMIIGVLFGYFMSYRFTKPIIRAAKGVKTTNAAKAIRLKNTGLTEVDKLLETIQETSNMLLETSGKMSEIVEMVGLPLGVFEYRSNSNRVFFTEQLPKLLSLDTKTSDDIGNDKEKFITLLEEILTRPEEGEEDIYYMGEMPERWLKIKYTHKENLTIGVILDLTKDILEKKKIITDRDSDPLTGIYNRKAMQTKMEEIIKNMNDMQTTALLMFDLDNLKKVNDTYGHKWGDTYIKHAVMNLAEISKKHQILGRRSGDEFVVLLYDFKSKEEVRRCISSFYQNLDLDKLNFPDGTKKPITISGGQVWVNNPDLSFEQYLQRADELLYKAKNNYKGSCYESTFR